MGGGISAVVRDLAEVVIPNGSRISEPGWSGFITTGPTTSAVAAWLASAAVGGQRYMVHAFNHLERVYMDMGVELSSPSRGVLVWAVLRELGRAGVAARVERHVGFARHVAERVRAHPRLDLLLEPELSVACFRYAADDAVNAEILFAAAPHDPVDTDIDDGRGTPRDPAVLHQPAHPARGRGRACR